MLIHKGLAFLTLHFIYIMQHTTCNSFPDGIDSCLADPNCFLPMDFTFDDSFNACYGDMYIKNSTYNPGKYVGIILCSPTRYPSRFIHLF